MQVRDLKYKQQKRGIEWILKYFYETNVGELFKKGKLRYGIEFDVVKVSYTIGNQESFIHIPIDMNSKSVSDDVKDLLQSFILDTYEAYEFDGKVMRTSDVARLLGIHPNKLTNILQKVRQKAYSKGKHLFE